MRDVDRRTLVGDGQSFNFFFAPRTILEEEPPTLPLEPRTPEVLEALLLPVRVILEDEGPRCLEGRGLGSGSGSGSGSASDPVSMSPHASSSSSSLLPSPHPSAVADRYVHAQSMY